MPIGVKDCPTCGAESTVIDSRFSKSYYGSIRRRRKCPKCHRHWRTVEIFEDHLNEVVTAKDITDLSRASNVLVGMIAKLKGRFDGGPDEGE